MCNENDESRTWSKADLLLAVLVIAFSVLGPFSATISLLKSEELRELTGAYLADACLLFEKESEGCLSGRPGWDDDTLESLGPFHDLPVGTAYSAALPAVDDMDVSLLLKVAEEGKLLKAVLVNGRAIVMGSARYLNQDSVLRYFNIVGFNLYSPEGETVSKVGDGLTISYIDGRALAFSPLAAVPDDAGLPRGMGW